MYSKSWSSLKQFQEAATEMCSAKKVFWEFQAKFFKSTRD